MGGQVVDEVNAIPEQPVLGMYMRYRREILGLTQEEAARRMYVSVSLYRKLENGERVLSGARLEDWCAAVGAPIWMLEKMVSLAMPKISTLARGAWPPRLRKEDLDHLNALPFPAYFHRFPEYEVLAANPAANAAMPWLAPAAPDAERPVNVIEQMMTVPEAREVLVNWDTIVHRLLFSLRILSPGVVAPERLAQIIETCSAHPEFERMWNTPVDEDLYNDSAIQVRIPGTGELITQTMRVYNVYHPSVASYQLFMLTPRAPGTPTVDPFVVT
ncbi:helix-turn-helix domain-containing protein [Nocardia sp. CDC160]|uniref:helix-turn-helix domain-containing protein n=1 Tax=Nocardia sp. CDC160 TaxID=3112166 RepID=UPI002DBE3B75|nr:helix-turn-helix domain-containing protein [Nocardia sp. CDC160]MEC3916980.1 helix-turn-helix domain-containing protein [Nocardia sp. CDC160]